MNKKTKEMNHPYQESIGRWSNMIRKDDGINMSNCFEKNKNFLGPFRFDQKPGPRGSLIRPFGEDGFFTRTGIFLF
jgi:hypothetical protein